MIDRTSLPLLSRHRARALVCALGVLAPVLGCGDDTSGASSGGGGSDGTGGASASTTSSVATTTTVASSGGAGGDGGAGGSGPVRLVFDEACEGALPTEEDLGAAEDPEEGDFTLEEALAGLPDGDGPLRAVMDTDHGLLSCTLFPEVAPLGVANFVGLARGLRPFQDPETDTWVRGRRFYDGLVFHRVIDDFMVQGGDPLGTGYGGPGYDLEDEIEEQTEDSLSHVPGTLAYANAGPDTNGSQFFVVAEVPADFLDGDYTIFGLCSPVETVQSLSEVQVLPSDRPLEPLILHRVAITRCAE